MRISPRQIMAMCMVSGALPMSSADAFAEEPISNMPIAKMDFETTPEGVGFAPLTGDRFTEPYMAMVRLPAGLVSPPHVKTANMFGVMVSGKMVHIAVDAGPEDEVILPAGSFYKVPAGMPHISKCISDVECITFLYQDGKFDFQPVMQ